MRSPRTGVPCRYRAVDAGDRAWRRARRPKTCLLAQRPALRDLVADKLTQDWSPEQISGWLAKAHPAGAEMRVSHETIYKTVFIQSRGVLANELQKHLRSQRPIRRSVHNTVTGQWRSPIAGAVSIRERPGRAEDRAIPGHWEGDLLCGRHWTQVATVVERATRFTVLVELDNRGVTTVTAGLKRTMTRLPEQLRKSLTWDRGMELADHKNVTVDNGLAVFFADPRSPWQRGTNENTCDLGGDFQALGLRCDRQRYIWINISTAVPAATPTAVIGGADPVRETARRE